MTHLEEMINHRLYLYDIRTQEYQNWLKAEDELDELKKENLELKEKLLQLKLKLKSKRKDNKMTEEKGNTIQLMSLQHKSIKQINKEVNEAIQELYDRFPDCAYANLHITVEIYPESGDYE